MPESEKIILLVDDNPDDVDLMIRALRKNNLVNPVEIAHDGLEALEYLHGQHAAYSKVQLVVLDLNLPKLDGHEVLQKIRADERTRILPVVIMTTSRREEDMISSYELGANSYIRKPVRFEQFVEAVGRLGLYWILVNEIPSSKED